MIRQFVGVLLGGAVLVGSVGAQTLDPKDVAAGRKLFSSKNCTKCHMAEGKGNRKLLMDGPKAKLAKLTPEEITLWLTSPEQMTAKLAEQPENPMQKLEATDAEIKALAAYLRSRQPKS